MNNKDKYIRHLERQIALQPEITRAVFQDGFEQGAEAMARDCDAFIRGTLQKWLVATAELAACVKEYSGVIKFAASANVPKALLAIRLEVAPHELAVKLSDERGAWPAGGEIFGIVLLAHDLHDAIQGFLRGDSGAFERLTEIADRASGYSTGELATKYKELIDQGGRPEMISTEYMRSELSAIRREVGSMWEAGKELFERIDAMPENERTQAQIEAYARLLSYMKLKRWSNGRQSGTIWSVTDNRGLGRYVSNLLRQRESS